MHAPELGRDAREGASTNTEGPRCADRVDPGSRGVVPFRFACHRCGHCCSGSGGYVWLEPGDTESLARSLGMTEATFVATCVRDVVDPRSGRRGLALREVDAGDAGGRCVLLEGSNTCRAYDARPAQCRAFPYWPSVLADRVAFERARATCPGIAVDTSIESRQRAFARLAELYREVEACTGSAGANDGATCCLEGGSADELFATALEADFAADCWLAESDEPLTGCRLGLARPLGCRLSGSLLEPDASRFHERLRAIERELEYPAAYGRMIDHLRARGMVATREESR
jgi:Fe-S-cluster containining protein